MNLYNNNEYIEDVETLRAVDLPWNQLDNCRILLSGATGMIGSFLVDLIMFMNRIDGLNCHVYALGRSENSARDRFSKFWSDPHLHFVHHNLIEPLENDTIDEVDYVLHLASNTHPILYSTDPIGTITTNIIGAMNLLDFASEHNAKRFVLASSNEIYGENRGDVEFFDEAYCGYIDPNTLRAGYPESKRCGESLCQAYRHQRGVDAVIARFTRTYGPTMRMSNTRALSQFIGCAVRGEDVVLKSTGTQLFSYTYVADAVSGLMYTLLLGSDGEAYNIADETGDMMLGDLAGVVASAGGVRVVREVPDAVEAAGYSRATKARLDGSKLRRLGWRPQYDIERGVGRTIRILRSISEGAGRLE